VYGTGFQLTEMDADPVVLVPVRQEAPALAVTDEVGLQPAGQTVFAGVPNQAIGDQYERSIDEGDASGFAEAAP